MDEQDEKIEVFTLIEIAIVLVLIVYCWGGVLKGLGNWINNARVKSFANDFRKHPGVYYAIKIAPCNPRDDGQAVRFTSAADVNADNPGRDFKSAEQRAWNSATYTTESCLFLV
jgi:hypothetical protein